jgi:signal transduction histidine kinase
MHPNDTTEKPSRWVAMELAVPIAPLSPDISCAEVYEFMEQDETLFAVPIAADGRPLGLVGRISLLRQFARPYYREVYARKPITKLMDAAPLIVDGSLPIESISLLIATEKKTALNAGFIVTHNGLYSGTANTIDLLRLSADRARQHAQELGVAHQEIRTLNQDLERRVHERTAELRAAQAEILSKERLSALGQLTATVAHELRNPLSSIRNTLFTIKETLAQSAMSFERPVSRMERSIARCDGIISDLLDYSRVSDLRRRPVTADKWLEETLDDQTRGEGVIIIRKFGAAGCRINVDTERMRRVIVNLLDNAVQAMAEAGIVTMERLVVFTTHATQGEYELVIEDTGPGIPAEIMPKIFEPLFSTKSFGTGLGLPTVKQIVEQHGGSIAIDSALGQGTRVAIRLPQASAKVLAA